MSYSLGYIIIRYHYRLYGLMSIGTLFKEDNQKIEIWVGFCSTYILSYSNLIDGVLKKKTVFHMHNDVRDRYSIRRNYLSSVDLLKRLSFNSNV